MPKTVNNKNDRHFDIESRDLPDWISQRSLTSGEYPYSKRMKRKAYENELQSLQIELLKLQAHVRNSGLRVVALFEGRDSAGKGGCIKRFMEHLNPRHARSVALTKPTSAESGQWYFQRYCVHLPTAGNIVLFDRSWYNRAGVERVMGFCDEQQLAAFMREAPQFESILVRDGVILFKFYLTIGQETQLKRLHERRHSPLKRWKLSDLDLAAIEKWDAYTEAQREMFHFTHTTTCPWTVVRANDQRRARIEVIRTVLSSMSYDNKDEDVVGAPNPQIVANDGSFFDGPTAE
ncbi:MAG: polyphosphate kinase 2 [Hyphomicrobiaceae bacterium]